jgi:hypothetical protein
MSASVGIEEFQDRMRAAAMANRPSRRIREMKASILLLQGAPLRFHGLGAPAWRTSGSGLPVRSCGQPFLLGVRNEACRGDEVGVAGEVESA